MCLAQDYAPSKCWSWGLNPSSLSPEPVLSTIGLDWLLCCADTCWALC